MDFNDFVDDQSTSEFNDQSQEMLFCQNEEIIKVMKQISILPNCSERILLQLIEECLLIKQTNQSLKRETSNFDLIKENQLLNIITQLKSQLSIDFQNDLDFRIFIENLTIFIKTQNLQGVLLYCEKLLKKLKPIDLILLKKIALEQQDNLNLFQGQDLIIFVSQKSKWTPEGDLKKQFQHKQNLDIYKQSNFEAKQIQFQQIGDLRQNPITLIHLPDLQNENGDENEAICFIEFNQLIGQCKNIRPFILFSYEKNQESGDQIAQIFNQLSKFIDQIEDQISAFSYLFISFPNDVDINEYLKQIQKNISLRKNEKDIQNILCILDDMIEKTKSDELRLNSLDDISENFLKKLLKKPNFEKNQRFFQFNLSQSLKNDIIEQVKLHKQYIISAIKRNDYKSIGLKLDELKFLVQSQLTHFLQQQPYEECILFLMNNLTENYTKISKHFNDTFQNQEKLSHQDLLEYKQLIVFFQEINYLRQEHFNEFFIQESQVIKDFKEAFQNIQIDLSFESISSQQTLNSTLNITLISREFPENKNKVNYLIEQVNEKIETLVRNSFKLIKSNNLEEIIQQFQQIKAFSEYKKNYLDEKYDLKEYQDTLQIFKDYLQDIFKQNSFQYIIFNLEQNNYEDLSKMFSLLDQLEKSDQLKIFVNSDFICSLREILSSKCKDLVDKNIEKINEILIYYHESYFLEIQQYVDQVFNILKISGQEQIKTQICKSSLEKIVQKMRQLKQKVLEFVHQQEQKQQIINDFTTIMNILKDIKEAEWIDEYFKVKEYNNLIKELSGRFENYSLQILKKIEELDLEIKNLQNFKTAQVFIKQLNQMIAIEFIDDKLKENRVQTQKKFEKAIEEILIQQIEQYLKQQKTYDRNEDQPALEESNTFEQNFDHKLVERSIEFVAFCLKENYFQEKATQLQLELKNYTKKYGNDLNQQIENTIKKLKAAKADNFSEIKNHFSKLLKMIKNLCELKQYPNIFKYTQGEKRIKTFEDDLKFFCFELNTYEINPFTVDIEEVKLKITLLKHLELFDFFTKEKNLQDKYLQLQKILIERQKQDRDNIISLIEKQKFETTSRELKNNSFDQHFLRQVKCKLQEQINNLINNTLCQAITLSHLLEKNVIIQIADNIKQIRLALKTITQDNLIDKQELTEVESQQIKIKKIYNDKINNFIQSIKANIYTYDFYEAENKIEYIQEINQILQMVDEHSEIKEQILSFEKSIQLSIDNILNSYNTHDYNFYLHPPKTIQQKLSKALQKNSKYTELYNKFMKIVLEMFQKAIGELQDKKIQDKISSIQKLTLIYNTAPDDLKIKFQFELSKLNIDLDINQQNSLHLGNSKFNLGQFLYEKTSL